MAIVIIFLIGLILGVLFGLASSIIIAASILRSYDKDNGDGEARDVLLPGL